MLTMETLQLAARRLAASAARPARVILFGSYARGDADTASDVDLMVVDGVIRPRLANKDALEFPAQKKLPGRKYPNAGGYLIIQ